MKELLLGCWTKPQFELTELDKLIGSIEVLIGIVLVSFLLAAICIAWEELKEKYEDKKRRKNR